jgi:hypothetical protein
MNQAAARAEPRPKTIYMNTHTGRVYHNEAESKRRRDDGESVVCISQQVARTLRAGEIALEVANGSMGELVQLQQTIRPAKPPSKKERNRLRKQARANGKRD